MEKDDKFTLNIYNNLKLISIPKSNTFLKIDYVYTRQGTKVKDYSTHKW